MNTETVEKIDTATHYINGGGATTFAELIEEYAYPQPQRGQILEGEIMVIADDRLVLDVGSKRDAVVPYDEMIALDDTLIEHMAVGDEAPVWVMRTPVGEEDLLVSLQRGLEQQDWRRARALLQSGELIELPVVGHNKGGILVQFGMVQGFVPNSHVPELRYVQGEQERISLKSELVKQRLLLKLVEVDQKRRRLVFSRRDAQRVESRTQLAAMKPGQRMTGRVVQIKDYGAFVQMDAVTGLLHVSQLDHQYVEDPRDVVSVGEEIEVELLEVDEARGRLSLSRKAVLPDPWETAVSQLSERQLVEGTVTAVRDFGAFVRLPVGVEGLVHVSEMHPAAKSEPRAAFQAGDKVLARILEIRPQKQQIGLSFRRVSAQEEVDFMARRRATAAAEV